MSTVYEIEQMLDDLQTGKVRRNTPVAPPLSPLSSSDSAPPPPPPKKRNTKKTHHDVSSAEEESEKRQEKRIQQIRVRPRSKPRARPSPSPSLSPLPLPLPSPSPSPSPIPLLSSLYTIGDIPVPPDTDLGSVARHGQLDHIPEIRNMEEVQIDFPHLGNDVTSGKPICDLVQYKMLTQRVLPLKPKRGCKPCLVPSTESTTVTTRLAGENAAEAARMAATDPWQLDLMCAKFRMLCVPTFYHSAVSQVDLSQEMLHKHLRRRTLVLPIMKTDIESALLHEAGTWMCSDGIQRHFPPCSNGTRCVGCMYDFPEQTRNVVFTATMFPDEYELFLVEKRAHSIVRPCICCLRYSLVDWVTFLRSVKTVGEASEVNNAASPYFDRSNQVYQLYRNLSDCEGGYFSEYMTRPDSSGCEAIIEPICRLNRCFMVMRTHETGQAWLDQSAIVWRHRGPLIPNIGENLAHF